MIKVTKTIIALFTLVFAGQVMAMTADYSVNIDSVGNAQAILTLNGSGTIDLPLPVDVASPQVSGALYVQSPQGIKVSIGSTEKATISYSSSAITSKSEGVWAVELGLPNTDSVSVMVGLPGNALVSVTQPTATIEQQGNKTMVSWNVSDGRERVVAQYSLEGNGMEAAKDYTLLYVLVVLVVLVAIGTIILGLKKKP